VYILYFGRRYVVDSIAVVEMCCYILRENKYILFKEKDALFEGEVIMVYPLTEPLMNN
jgi:hypothetical protein